MPDMNDFNTADHRGVPGQRRYGRRPVRRHAGPAAHHHGRQVRTRAGQSHGVPGGGRRRSTCSPPRPGHRPTPTGSTTWWPTPRSRSNSGTDTVPGHGRGARGGGARPGLRRPRCRLPRRSPTTRPGRTGSSRWSTSSAPEPPPWHPGRRRDPPSGHPPGHAAGLPSGDDDDRPRALRLVPPTARPAAGRRAAPVVLQPVPPPARLRGPAAGRRTPCPRRPVPRVGGRPGPPPRPALPAGGGRRRRHGPTWRPEAVPPPTARPTST